MCEKVALNRQDAKRGEEGEARTHSAFHARAGLEQSGNYLPPFPPAEHLRRSRCESRGELRETKTSPPEAKRENGRNRRRPSDMRADRLESLR